LVENNISAGVALMTDTVRAKLPHFTGEFGSQRTDRDLCKSRQSLFLSIQTNGSSGLIDCQGPPVLWLMNYRKLITAWQNTPRVITIEAFVSKVFFRNAA